MTVQITTSAADTESAGVDCPGDNARALGGGTSTTDTSPGNGLLTSVPTENNSATDLAEADDDIPTGWFANWENISGPTR